MAAWFCDWWGWFGRDAAEQLDAVWWCYIGWQSTVSGSGVEDKSEGQPVGCITRHRLMLNSCTRWYRHWQLFSSAAADAAVPTAADVMQCPLLLLLLLLLLPLLLLLLLLLPLLLLLLPLLFLTPLMPSAVVLHLFIRIIFKISAHIAIIISIGQAYPYILC